MLLTTSSYRAEAGKQLHQCGRNNYLLLARNPARPCWALRGQKRLRAQTTEGTPFHNQAEQQNEIISPKMEPIWEMFQGLDESNRFGTTCVVAALTAGALVLPLLRHRLLPKPPPLPIGVSTSMSYLHEADNDTSALPIDSPTVKCVGQSRDVDGEWTSDLALAKPAVAAPFASLSSSTTGGLTRVTDSVKLRMAFGLQVGDTKTLRKPLRPES